MITKIFHDRRYRLVRCCETFAERDRMVNNYHRLGIWDVVTLVFNAEYPNSIWRLINPNEKIVLSEVSKKEASKHMKEHNFEVWKANGNTWEYIRELPSGLFECFIVPRTECWRYA